MSKRRIAVALGGNPLTCMGLAGMGDLIVTCTSRYSRNRTFGEAFVAGESLADYQGRTGMVVEGAEAAKSILQLAEKKGIQVPITRVVHDILYRGMDLDEAVDALMGRYAYDEFYDVRNR
jgi:glycerol-3-phosphate dehydrogenase (NAD(P)+)